MNSGYLDSLKYYLCDSLSLPGVRDIDWMEMMDRAERQAIVCIIYGGMQRAGKTLGMPFDALMEWVGYAQQIETQNRIVNKRCVELTRKRPNLGPGLIW